MKHKITSLFLFGTIFLTSLQSCKKYPDGPEISFTSRTARISNQWSIENYKINGNDFTSLASGYTETFSKNGAYSYSWAILNETGTWNFQNKDKEVKLTGGDGQTSRTLFIQKLEKKSFWYYYMDGDDKYELHLIAD